MGLKQLADLNLPHFVSLVGAGGKTTVMYSLAYRLAGQGRKVLVVTTTRIYEPDPDYRANTLEEAHGLWRQGKFAVIGRSLPAAEKITAPEPVLLEQLARDADVVLAEADGSRHYPIKAPRAGEPVLLPDTDLVLAVMGMSAVGLPLEKVCFGLEEAMELLGVGRRHILTEADAATLLASEAGGRKAVGSRRFAVVLNQCDDVVRKKSAQQIGALLNQRGIREVYGSAFNAEEQTFFNRLAGAGANEAKICMI